MGFDSKNDIARNVNDGFFELIFLNDGVYLSVYPPIKKGRKIEIKDVVEKLSKKRIREFKKELVEQAIASKDNVTVKIAEVQEELKIDAKATVSISSDKMKAYITITAPDGGRMYTNDELFTLLKENGVVHGVNKAVLEALSKKPVFDEKICIADGTPPISGKNGKVNFHFDINKSFSPKILEDGSVDFRELGLIECVNKGQVLCTLLPPTPGIPGRTVVGSDIPIASGKPAVMPKGKNVEISDDGHTLFSSVDGQASYVDGKINVFPTYTVHADVDTSTGNISFVGNVTINGNVLSGFVVEAGGDVEIWGVVEGAYIRAGGNVILRRGMQGHGKGILISGGSIVARYIENSSIEAKENISAEAIMHSNVKCGNKLELSGKKGLLVGGTCRVGKEITAKVIGSHLATVTDIEVGTEPEIKERYKEVKDKIIKLEMDMKKTEQAISLLSKLESANALTPNKGEMLSRTVRTKVFLNVELGELRDELALLEVKLAQEAQGKINVYDSLYAGTKLAIGTSIMHVKENLQYCTIYRDGIDIRVGPMMDKG